MEGKEVHRKRREGERGRSKHFYICFNIYMKKNIEMKGRKKIKIKTESEN